MAAKRKPKPPRAIQPPPYGPGSRSGAEELAVTAGDLYRVAVEGPEIVDPILGKLIDASRMVRGIRGPDGKFDARPGMTESAMYDEVARLNAGLPVSKESQGIGRRPHYATEAVRWVEILLSVPETRTKLLAARGGKLSTDEVRGLMTYHDDKGGPDIRKVFPLPTVKESERKLIVAVSKQLERALGIRRKMSRGTGSQLNDERHSKRRAASRARSGVGINPEDIAWMQRAKKSTR